MATFNVMFDFGGADEAPASQVVVDALGPPCIRFKTEDDGTIDTVNPIPIPAVGLNYSYWKHIYLYCTSAPTTQINNIKFYTDGGGFQSSAVLYVGSETPKRTSGSTSGYVVAVGTADAILTSSAPAIEVKMRGMLGSAP